jgi:hypothetical protein
MTDASGTWNITISTLFGSMSGTLDLKVAGSAVTGTGRADGNAIALSEGTVSGDELSIPLKLTSPIQVDAVAKLTVSGDTLKGKIVGGPIPGIKVSGTKVSGTKV